MTELERLATEIFNECKADNEPVTMEEATEMAKAEIGAKNIKSYTQADEPKKKSAKPKELDAEKVDIIAYLNECLSKYGSNIVNPQKEVAFTLNGNSYSVSLVKHRPPKN